MAKKAKRAFQMMLSWLSARATDEGRLALTADEGRRLLSSERGRQLAFEAYHRLDFAALEEEPEKLSFRRAGLNRKVQPRPSSFYAIRIHLPVLTSSDARKPIRNL